MNEKKIEYLIKSLQWMNDNDGSAREMLLNQLLVELDISIQEKTVIPKRSVRPEKPKTSSVVTSKYRGSYYG